MRRPRHAFTLVELLIVMLVMGILAGAAAPKYRQALEAFRAEAAAKRVASDLRLARRVAMSTATPQPVLFAVGSDAYSLPSIADGDRRNRAYTVDLTSQGYSAVLASSTLSVADTVTFNIHGYPDSTGVLEWRSGQTTATVAIDAAGVVTVN